MNDATIRRAVSWVLRVGVAASAALLLIGMALGYSGQAGASAFGSLLIALGVFVLLVTPITRVLISVIAFSLERNRLYFAITLVVFMDIMFAIFAVPLLLHV